MYGLYWICFQINSTQCYGNFGKSLEAWRYFPFKSICSCYTSWNLKKKKGGGGGIVETLVAVAKGLIRFNWVTTWPGKANYIPIQRVPFTQLFHDFFLKVIGLAASWLLFLLCFSSCHFDIFYAFFRRERLIECEKSRTLTGCQNPLQHKPTCQLTCFRFISKVSSTQTCIASPRTS